MRNHILLEKAKKYEIPDSNMTPSGCSYKIIEGFWVDNNTNIAIMKTDGFQKPISKKCDIETGEDQKGE